MTMNHISRLKFCIYTDVIHPQTEIEIRQDCENHGENISFNMSFLVQTRISEKCMLTWNAGKRLAGKDKQADLFPFNWSLRWSSLTLT